MPTSHANLSSPSQYPEEREILFPPLSALEVLGRTVEGAVTVVRVRICTNPRAVTIEQIVSKLQRSHVTLLDLLLDDLRACDVPERTLLSLDGLREDAAQLEPSWFLGSSNLQAAFTAAMDARQKVRRRAQCRSCGGGWAAPAGALEEM